MAGSTSTSGAEPRLDPASARRAVRAWERIFREEIAKMNGGLSTALKAALDFEAILKETVNVDALRNASKTWGKAITEGVQDGLKSGGGEGTGEGRGGSEKKDDAPEGGGKSVYLDVIKQIGKLALDFETPLKIREEAEEANLSMPQWQAWQSAARETGADADGKNILNFFKKLHELMGKADSSFKEYGISTDDSHQAALDLAEVFHTIGKEKRDELRDKLKIDDKIEEKLLRMGKERLAGLVRSKQDPDGFTEEDVERILRFKNALDEFKKQAIPAQIKIQKAVLDAGTPLIEGANDFIKGQRMKAASHKNLVEPSAPTDAPKALTDAVMLFVGACKALGGTGNWMVSTITANRRGMKQDAGEAVEGLKIFGKAAMDLTGAGLQATGASRQVDTPHPDDFVLDPLDNLDYLKELSKNSPGPEFSSSPFFGADTWLMDTMLDVMEMNMGLKKPSSIYLEEPRSPFSPAPVTHETTVNVGEVTVNTQATDAWGMAGDMSAALMEMIPRQIVNASDTGVAR